MYDEQAARKVLYDIFLQLSEKDIKAMNFFLRSDNGNGKHRADMFELLEILEHLAYFTIKTNCAKFDKLIELLKNIDRLDLQKQLQQYAKELQLPQKKSVEADVEIDSTQKASGEEEKESLKVVSSQTTITRSAEKEKESLFEIGSPQKTTTSGSDEEEKESLFEITSPQKTTTNEEEKESLFEIASPQETTTSDENLNTLKSGLAKISIDPNNRVETEMNDGLTAENSSFQPESTPETEEQTDKNTEIKLYNYQIELAEHGKTPGENSIICSPTGSGKTITAASVIKHHLELAEQNNSIYRVLYLVHIRYLVKHLSTDLKKILGKHVHPFGEDEFLDTEVIRKKGVVILTAQILVNALNSKSVKFSDYNLLVIDECHHTVHKHPYNEIMKKYHEAIRQNNRVPQILGLSATLGSGSDPFKAIVDICANMCTFWVSCVRDETNLEELEERNQAPIIDEVISCKARTTDDGFSKEISCFMKKYIMDLELEHNIKFDDAYTIGTTELESFLSQKKKVCEKNKMRTSTKIIEFLYIMNKAMIYYSDLTALCVEEYLDENVVEPESPCQDIEITMYDHYENLRKDFSEYTIDDKLENNDKLVKLKELLTKILKQDPEKKVLLLCLTRFNAIHLKKIIKEDKDLKTFVKTDYIIGQSGDHGLTQNQQVNVLKRFESHELNLLISTSIAQEGLNIPDCEIVIRYEYVTSDVSRAQAKGRARKKESKHYLIARENSSSIFRDIRNKQREEEMKVALEKVTKLGKNEFENEVQKRIKELYQISDENKELEKSKYHHEGSSVKIFCKTCHTELCKGSEIIKKGSDYICINPEFPSKINKKMDKGKEFRYDSNIGNSQCRGEQCSNMFGAIKQYKRGNRPRGYVLNIKSVLFQVNDKKEKSFLNKWSERPFKIKEEKL